MSHRPATVKRPMPTQPRLDGGCCAIRTTAWGAPARRRLRPSQTGVHGPVGLTCRSGQSTIHNVRLSRLGSIALSALLTIGHSLCLCPPTSLAGTGAGEATHACCPPTGQASHEETSHSSKPCPHCSTALKGTLEAPRADVVASVERPLLPVVFEPAPTVPVRVLSVLSTYQQPPNTFALASPERLHVSLLI